MKKHIVLITLISMCLFAGCSSAPNEESTNKTEELLKGYQDTVSSEESNRADTDLYDDKSNAKTSKDNEKQQEINYGSLDTSYFSDIGASPDGVAAVHGEISESLWADGPLYRFGDSTTWYAFSEYDFGEDDNTYVPLGECTQISIEMDLLVKGADVYEAETLEHLTGSEFKKEFDEMDQINVYYLSYGGYELKIYANTKSAINADSMVTVIKK